MQHARDNAQPRANALPNPSRRSLIGASLSAMLAGVAIATAARGASTTDADAELLAICNDTEILALCAEYHRQHDIAYAPLGRPNFEYEEALDETWAICDELIEMPAVSEAGRRAKAGVALRLFAEEDRCDLDCQFVMAVLRDLSGGAAT